MNTNAALVIPAPSPASNEAAELVLRDIKPPVEVPNPWLWLWWALGILVFAALVFFLWRWWNKKQPVTKAERVVPPHERARKKLEAALRLLSEPEQFTVSVSDTIRVYLEERFNFHAPERTTEEFLYELQHTKHLTPDQKQSLGDFLSRCDLVKFARYEPTEAELRELHAAANRLIDETEPKLSEQIPGPALPIPSSNK